MDDSPSSPLTLSRQSEHAVSGVIVAAFCLVLIATWAGYLWPRWLHDPDLAHGLAAPLVFALLIREARNRGNQHYLPPSRSTFVLTILAALAGIGLLIIGGLYAAALGWSHSLVAFTLATALSAVLAAAGLYGVLSNVRLLPFNWPAGVATFLWLWCVPFPPGTYTRLTQSLQGGVTSVVVAALHWLGLAATRDGNVIVMPTVSVGIEEACSGVRSLLSCIFAGIFFSATLVRRPRSRVIIIALAGPLALGMNLLRSLTLTLLAYKGVEIRGAWHDLTGFAVLGVTAAILALASLGLDKLWDQKTVQADPNRDEITAPITPLRKTLAAKTRGVLFATFALCLVLIGFFVVKTQPSPRAQSPMPDLATRLPAEFAGWQVVTNHDLFQFSSQLQTDALAQRTYGQKTSDGSGQITAYLAYWPRGQASVSLVASHTPDACWPGSGWIADHSGDRQVKLVIDGRILEKAEQRLFSHEGYPQYVWYWHLVDGKVIHHAGVGSPAKLLALAWSHGFRRDGSQLFVRISSNRSWEEIQREPLLEEIFRRLKYDGL